MNKKILLVGGGGHCKSVLNSLIGLNEYTDIGIVDKIENVGKKLMGIPIVGCDNDLLKLYNVGYKYAFVTLGSIGNPSIRIKLYNMLTSIGYIIPNIIDPSARVSKFSTLGQGVFIGNLSIINADSIIENAAIINSGSIIEHDCKIGEFAHIASGAVLSGGVVIGRNSHIGSNATIRQQVCIGDNTIIGMGSVVTHNIKNNVLAYGNPCKEVKII